MARQEVAQLANTVEVKQRVDGKLVDIRVSLNVGQLNESTHVIEACEFGPKKSDRAHIEAWAIEQAEKSLAVATDPELAARRAAEAAARQAEQDAIDEVEARATALEDALARIEKLERSRLLERTAALESAVDEARAKIDDVQQKVGKP